MRLCGCECVLSDIQETARRLYSEVHLSIVSDDRSSRFALYTPRRAAPVRAIVFTSDSLSLIFNKPTRGKQNKTPRPIVCGSVDRRGAARRGPVRFRIDSPSLSPPRRFRRRSRRYGRGTHGYLFEQLIYNPRKYTGRGHPRASRRTAPKCE